MIDFSTVKDITIPEGSVSKITSGSALLWERSGLLPSVYQQVEYIQADGNQAIDTGVMASDYQDGLQYVFMGQCTGLSTKTNNYLFGCLYDGKRSANPSLLGSNLLLVIVGGNGSGVCSKRVVLNTDFVLDVKGSSKAIEDFIATYNGEPFTRTDSEFINTDMPSSNIYLLACNINGNYYSSTSAPFMGKLYSFVMEDMRGEEIRHFVPCYRKADGIIGLYDIISKGFYTNIGSGSFTKGADV